jgi:hypothetical protein
MLKRKEGGMGWILLAIFVWAWDWYAPESLTQAFWRGLDNSHSRPFVLFGFVWVTSHLFLKKPQRILIWW